MKKETLKTIGKMPRMLKFQSLRGKNTFSLMRDIAKKDSFGNGWELNARSLVQSCENQASFHKTPGQTLFERKIKSVFADGELRICLIN